MTNRAIPSGFLQTVLRNGIGRYVCQLQRVTIQFCKERPNSQGARDFMENKLLDFTRANPGVAVYAQVRRHKAPRIVAEYLNGKTHAVDLNCKEEAEICEWLDWLRTRSGDELIRIRKYQHTATPSIQGTWTPHTNRAPSLNTTVFPDPELSRTITFKQTTTEKLQEIAKKSQGQSE